MIFPEPPMDVYEGKGLFRKGNTEYESSFTLYITPFKMWLKAHEQKTFDIPSLLFDWEGWALVGKLSDGRSINCPNMTGSQSFHVHSPIMLGDHPDESPKQGIFPLANYFEGKAELMVGDWSISIIDADEQNTKHAKEMSDEWRLPTSGLHLILENPRATSEEHKCMAWNVTKLLSLAAGTGIAFYLGYTLKWENGDKLDVLGQWLGAEFGPGKCIPAHYATKFLSTTISTFNSWPKEKQDMTWLAFQYINLSGRGYLDEKFLSIVQAWEFLSDAWSERPNLKPTEIELKNRLQLVCERWRKKYDGIDNASKWQSRILAPFRRPSLRDNMEGLANKYKLKADVLELDFKTLKDARDKIAHTGSLPDKVLGDKRYALKLLQSAQLGLRLIILRELGYDGQVVTHTNGWYDEKPISDFIG